MMLKQRFKAFSVITVIVFTLAMFFPGSTSAQDVLPTYSAEIKFPWIEVYGWVPILSFEYAEQQEINTKGNQASKVQMADIRVSRLVDRHSTELFLACAKGTRLNEVWIRVYIGDMTQDVMEIRLRDVSVSSYSSIGESGMEPPKESFTLGYTQIYYGVYEGQVLYNHGWDLLKNKQLT